MNIDQLKEKYDKLYAIRLELSVDDFTTEEKEYIFKKPTMASYDRFIKTATQSPSKATKMFVLDNIVEEQKEMLMADMEEYPALSMSLQDKLFTLLGLSKDISVKKL